jgi:hypothetical protein
MACGDVPLHVRWPAFVAHGRGLFVWEALVTGAAKSDSHVADAAAAVAAFRSALPKLEASSVSAEHPLSLVGAAALWSGWVEDSSILHEAPFVARAAIK